MISSLAYLVFTLNECLLQLRLNQLRHEGREAVERLVEIFEHAQQQRYISQGA